MTIQRMVGFALLLTGICGWVTEASQQVGAEPASPTETVGWNRDGSGKRLPARSAWP